MESRFRRLLSPRRVEQPTSELEMPRRSNQSPPSTTKFSGFFQHQLKRRRAEKRQEERVLDFRSFSYEDVLPGKPPIISDRPIRGNGPLRLQINRRSSSGELVPTGDDYQTTLGDMSDGQYVLGMKTSHKASRDFGGKQSFSMASVEPLGMVLSAPISSRTFNGQRSPPETISGRFESYGSGMDIGSEPPIPQRSSARLNSNSAISSDPGDNHYDDMENQLDGLGISSLHNDNGSDCIHPSNSILEPHEEQNASVQALWKAEYKRLVTMYGQAGVDKHIAELNREQQKVGTSYAQNPTKENSQWMFEPLPRPSLDTRYTAHTRRSSGTSHIEVYGEDHSDESSQKRLSFLSSIGGSSSYTGRTSMTETDPATTLEDLRKVVDEMRTTYLRAIEEQAPTNLATTKSTSKKKRRKRSKSLPAASIEMPKALKTRQSAIPTVQPNRPITPVQTHARKSSASSFCKLPVIEASPAKSEKESVDKGLKRADSTTLGAMFAPGKRDQIARRHMSQPSASKTLSRSVTAQDLDIVSTPPSTTSSQKSSDHYSTSRSPPSSPPRRVLPSSPSLPQSPSKIIVTAEMTPLPLSPRPLRKSSLPGYQQPPSLI